jgi:hypothetical protein
MVDILNPGLPYFGPININFACGRAKSRVQIRLRLDELFRPLCPALLLGITCKTTFVELNNPPFLIARGHDAWAKPASVAVGNVRLGRDAHEHHVGHSERAAVVSASSVSRPWFARAAP